jgi:hypothetical protein
VVRDIQALARTHTKEAVAALVYFLSSEKLGVAAASALLDRGYGKPMQTLNVRRIKDIADLDDAELAMLAGITIDGEAIEAQDAPAIESDEKGKE